MGAPSFSVVEPLARGELDELDDVRLTVDVQVSPDSILRSGARGTIVAVHGHGEVYDVEFAEPFHALLSLDADEVEAIPGTTRERLIAETGDVHR